MAHDHEHDHDHDEEYDDDALVVLENADGEEVEFVFLATVDVRDETFALLTPADEEEDEDADQTAVYIFRYEEDEDGGETFSDVEDEELLKEVQAAAEKLFAEWEAESGGEEA